MKYILLPTKMHLIEMKIRQWPAFNRFIVALWILLIYSKLDICLTVAIVFQIVFSFVSLNAVHINEETTINADILCSE